MKQLRNNFKTERQFCSIHTCMCPVVWDNLEAVVANTPSTGTGPWSMVAKEAIKILFTNYCVCLFWCNSGLFKELMQNAHLCFPNLKIRSAIIQQYSKINYTEMRWGSGGGVEGSKMLQCKHTVYHLKMKIKSGVRVFGKLGYSKATYGMI